MDKENFIDNDFNDLTLRFFSEKISDSEVERLKLWVNQSEGNKRKFNEIRVSWMATAQIQKTDPYEIQIALDSLNQKIRLNQEEMQSKNVYSIKRVIRIAAIFLLTISISSLATYFVLKNRTGGVFPGKENVVLVYAPIGSKAMTVLPDGTHVWLNAGSKLSYATNYNNGTRIVKLEGEGFFEVKTNPQKPFIVKAKELDIKAYGTAFNVKAYLEEKEVITTLVRGKVYIEGKDKHNKSFIIQMKPEQCVTYLTNRYDNDLKQHDTKKSINTNPKIPEELKIPIITANSVTTELYTSWKDNRWVIKGEEIGKLATSLERRYNIHIVFNSEELKNYRFTGIFQNETVEQALQVLKMTAPLHYEIGKGIVTLSIDNSMKMKFKKYIDN